MTIIQSNSPIVPVPMQPTQPAVPVQTPATVENTPTLVQSDALKISPLNQGQALQQISLELVSTHPEIEPALKQLEPFLVKNRLSVKEKKQVLKLLHHAKKEGYLPALAQAMDEKGTLGSLYYKMKLPHKPHDGRFAIPIRLNNGGTFVLTQAHFPNYAPDTDFEDRSENLLRLLKKGDVDPAILNKLN